MPPFDGDLPGRGVSCQCGGLQLTGQITRETFRAEYKYNLRFWRGEYIGKFERYKAAFLLLKNIRFLTRKENEKRLPGYDGYCYASRKKLANHEDLKTDKGNLDRLLDILVRMGLLIELPGLGPKGTTLRKPTKKGTAWVLQGGWPMWYNKRKIPRGGVNCIWTEDISPDWGTQNTPQETGEIHLKSSERDAGAPARDARATPPAQTTGQAQSKSQVRSNPVERSRDSHPAVPSPDPTQLAADPIAAINSLVRLDRDRKQQLLDAYLGTEQGVHWFDARAIPYNRQVLIHRLYPESCIDFREIPAAAQSHPESQCEQSASCAEPEAHDMRDEPQGESLATMLDRLILEASQPKANAANPIPEPAPTEPIANPVPAADPVAAVPEICPTVSAYVTAAGQEPEPTPQESPNTKPSQSDAEMYAQARNYLGEQGLLPRRRRSFARRVTAAEIRTSIRAGTDGRRGRKGSAVRWEDVARPQLRGRSRASPVMI